MTVTPQAPPPPPAHETDTGVLIRDFSVSPTAIIPRKALVWVFGLCALLLIILIVAFGGSRAVQKQAAAALVPAATPADPERLRVYERELQRAPVAAAVQPQAVSAIAPGDPRSLPPNPYVDAPTYAPPVAKPIDQVAADRARKEYESLFSSNVVLSKRTGADTLAATGSSAVPSAPSLDAITASVLRQMGTPPAPPTGPSSAGPTAVTPAPAVARQTAPSANLHRVYEGTVIDAVLANRLDGSGIAPVRALVTNDVYAQDMTRVIPAGAMVLGTASAVTGMGQSRLAVAFHRIVGEGIDVTLDQFVGLNIRGDAGLKDKTDNHYLSIFGAAAAVGLIGGLSQAVGGAFSRDNTTIVIGGSTDAASQAAAQTMQRFSNRMPTVTIREGARLKVYVTSDLDLKAYRDVD